MCRFGSFPYGTYRGIGTESFGSTYRLLCSAIGLIEDLIEKIRIVDMNLIGIDADNRACYGNSKLN